MNKRQKEMLLLLKANKGFDQPEKWIRYGIDHNFKSVKAVILDYCPDCGSQQFKTIGQYIYYSTLLKLKECSKCGLVYSNTLIDPQVIHSHFEHAYKDEDYFHEKRYKIFEQIAALVDEITPESSSVLDIGGAKGHLLARIKKRRQDLNLTLNDLSRDACAFASDTFELDTICGDIKAIESTHSSFDTILLSDVLYYEPHLNKFWELLPLILSEDGVVIIRVPNKLPWIRFSQSVLRWLHPREKTDMQDQIKFLNPEHIYVFSRQYLISRLRTAGFTEIFLTPSELLLNNKWGFLQSLYYKASKLISIMSNGKLITTPSLLVLAKHPGSNITND